jgi:hypothetical protein
VILELPLLLWCGSGPGIHHPSVRIMGFRYYNKEVTLRDEATWTSRLRQIMLVPTNQVPLSLLISINYEMSPEQGVWNYETNPTGINSIGDLELQIQNK